MAEQSRPDPDAILAELRLLEPTRQGRLTVFLGMCPGVGKTYTMLQYARQRQKEGVNVHIGIVETHDRTETEALLEGLSFVPRRIVEYKSIKLEEMDLDAILERRPELVLVDELAHTNVPSSRHPKRYQDVFEILDAGISVYTTLNVQHIESRIDIVHQITGVTVRETVPDSVLDRADEIQLVDLTPEQLRQRLEEGKVYLGEMAQAAAVNFFKLENIAALREMALRFAAERADDKLRGAMRERKISGPWKSGERLLVAVGPDAYAESLIRWTRRIAGELGCQWLAVYVGSNGQLEPSLAEQVTRNLSLARQLGGEVIITSDRKIADAILRIARERNVSQIIVGRPTRSPWLHWLKGRSPAYDLIRHSGYIDVYVVQPEKQPAGERTTRILVQSTIPVNEFLFAGAITLLLTGAALLVEPITGNQSIALLYLMLVVVLGLKLNRSPVLATAAISALLWNFLFTEPRYTLYITNFHDAIMFGMFFVVALAMGHLTTQLRRTEMAERQRERRTAALYELARQAAFATDLDTGLRAAVNLIESTFAAKVALLLRQSDHTLANVPHSASSLALSEKEKSVAAWAFSRRMPAGKFTETLPDSEALHLPLQGRTAVMGVLSVRSTDRSFDLTQRDLLEAFAVLIGLVLEKNHIIEAFKRAEILEASEHLRRSLLESVSHELKTPLAAVQAGIDALSRHLDSNQRGQTTLTEVQLAVRRLHRVINNLLNMTRIESGVIQPKLDWCDVEELAQAAIELAGEGLGEHQIIVDVDRNLPMVKVDQPLLEQCLCNLLLNSVANSPPGTKIIIRGQLRDEQLILSVLDEGNGIRKEDLTRIFDAFYRGADASPGGTGLGLAIVDGFVRAHGGNVRGANRQPRGAEFVITIPVETLAPEIMETFA